MENNLKSRLEEILESLKDKVEILDYEDKTMEALKEVEKELSEYRFENQKRIKESQEDIATFVLTA